MRLSAKLFISVALFVSIGWSQALQGVPENAVKRVSDHVCAIIGFPNIAFVVGTRATLVVDTGMGPRNALELERQGTSVEEAGKLLQAEFKSKYPDWENMNPVPKVVRRAYEEAAR